jgi:hypothetical protein
VEISAFVEMMDISAMTNWHSMALVASMFEIYRFKFDEHLSQ